MNVWFDLFGALQANTLEAGRITRDRAGFRKRCLTPTMTAQDQKPVSRDNIRTLAA
jgi:hypothetical protein